VDPLRADRGALKFKAVTGLPRNPLPTYASFVIEGTVDLDRGSGIVTKSIYAGAPQAMSNVLFAGAARTIRVTTVDRSGNATSRLSSTSAKKWRTPIFLGTAVVLQVL